MIYDVIIFGTGPAGYTAALYSSRAFLKTLMLTGPEHGGQLTTTTEVDNYPGFAQGIQGPALMEEMKKQVERFGTEIKLETVKTVRQKDDKTFIVTTEKGEYESKTVIVATGASAKYLGLASETRLMGKGVSACATCDGFFFKGKEVVVIGGGDTAMEEATFLTKFATKVTIIHRRSEFRASPIMLDRAKKNEKIVFLTGKTVEEVVGETAVTGVKLKDNQTGKQEEIKAQGFFLAIGHQPNTIFLKDVIDLDEKGYIIVKSQISNSTSQTNSNFQNPKLNPQTETSIPGIFAAGDCVDPRYRQAIVAAGMGCMAAMDAQKMLEEKG